MRRRWWFAGLLALGLAQLAHAATLVTGAGATFPYPLYSKWFDEFHKRNPDLQTTCQSIGSGGGIRQVLEGTVDFGATDGPMTDEQLRAAPVPILHLPTALGAVVPTFNLPGVERLRFTPEALAGIFLGQITHWNDPALTKENPNIALPTAAIVPIHRSDGSGTTYIFTDYLAKVSPEWQKSVGRGTSVNWPVGLGGKGNEGVAGLVKQTPNAIGYVELIYAVGNKLPYGDVRNRSGEVVAPGRAALLSSPAVRLARARPRGPRRLGDPAFRALSLAFALSVIAIAGTIAVVLLRRSALARAAFGWSFLWTSTWDPVALRFGALPFIYGTLATTAIAIAIALPLGLGAAVCLAELMPRRLADPLTFLIELLVAVPSVIYGLVGVFVLVPAIRSVQQALEPVLGSIPLFAGPAYGVGLLTAGIPPSPTGAPSIPSASRRALPPGPPTPRGAAPAPRAPPPGARG